MRSYGTTLLVLFFCINACLSKLYAQETINWQSIEQAEQAAQKQHRKMIIDIFTTWSDGAKEMERSVFNQPQIVHYINENFIPVKFDAETRNDVTFRSRIFHFVTESGVSFNQLASELLRGQMAYPTLVFLDENMNLIQTIQYRSPEHFEMIMTYFGDDNHKKIPWKKYEKTYQTTKNR